ncbi:hypothetical protein BKA56DRAFT_694619 [Ilyonectria sp. MPI-CAGE-AT-0026]|nr:hypothetical protein BKA56DRAFT_694619 [Ilyonectria sp. MPI-CAGE-AT-0026]
MAFKSPSYIPQLPFDPPETLPVHEFLFGGSEKFGRHPIGDSKPPFTCGISGKAHSAQEVAERIELLARALATRFGWKVNKGNELDKVTCVYSLNTIDNLTTAWATQRINGVSNSISAAYSVPELSHQLKRVSCKALFTCLPLLQKALEAAAEAGVPKENVFLVEVPSKLLGGAQNPPGIPTVDQLIDEGRQLPPLEPLAWTEGQGARQTAFLCCSSGTSGLPKNAKVSHKNVIANIMQAYTSDATYKNPEPELCLGVLPTSHNLGLVGVSMLSIYRGDGVVVLPRFDLEETLKTIHDYRIGRLWMVPPMIAAMVKAPSLVAKYDLSHVNAAVVGASSLSKETALAFDKLVSGCHLIQGYGLTETTVAVTFGNPLDYMFGTCGHLFPGCEGRLIKDDGQEITEYGKPGELLIRSPSVFLGYLDNESESKGIFSEDGWMRTGDLAEFRQSAAGHDHLFIIDRIKELIKVRGMQVSPAELEHFLARHPKVADAAVVPIPDESAGELPVAFIVKAPAFKDEDEAALRIELHEYVNKEFSQHKRLAGGIEFAEALAKTAAGKTQRKVLKDLAKARAEERRRKAAGGVEVFDFDSDDEDD